MAGRKSCKWSKGSFDTQSGKYVADSYRAERYNGKSHCILRPAGRKDRGKKVYDVSCVSWNKGKRQDTMQFGPLAAMKKWGCWFLNKY